MVTLNVFSTVNWSLNQDEEKKKKRQGAFYLELIIPQITP